MIGTAFVMHKQRIPSVVESSKRTIMKIVFGHFKWKFHGNGNAIQSSVMCNSKRGHCKICLLCFESGNKFNAILYDDNYIHYSFNLKVTHF